MNYGEVLFSALLYSYKSIKTHLRPSIKELLPMGTLGPPPAPLSKNTAAGCEVGGSPGLARDTQNGGHCCFCIYSGPRMDDVTSSGSGKQSHESSMNWTSLWDNKWRVSIAYFADLVQRRRLCLGCWNTGTDAGDVQREGGAFNYFLISRWGGKLRKKFQIRKSAQRCSTLITVKSGQLFLWAARFANQNWGLRQAPPPGYWDY